MCAKVFFLPVLFCSCHIGTVQTTAHLTLIPSAPALMSRLDRHFDGSSVVDPALNLFGDGFTYDGSIQLRLTDFYDIDLYIFIGKFFQLFLDLINFLTTFSNDDTRTRSIDGYRYSFQCPFDHNLGNTAFRYPGIQVVTNFSSSTTFSAKSFHQTSWNPIP